MSRPPSEGEELMLAELPEEQAALRRISAGLGALDAEARPGEGWQARVMAQILAEESIADLRTAPAQASAPDHRGDESPRVLSADRTPELSRPPAARRPGARRGWLAGGSILAAAVALLLLWPTPTRTRPELLVEIAPSSEPSGEGQLPAVRGDHHRIGTRLRVSANDAAPHRALWVFRSSLEASDPSTDTLLIQCPGSDCVLEKGVLSTELNVRLTGNYVLVALWSDAPLPPPEASRDESLAAAARAGAAQRSHSFTVR
jgi:hypothetical protein